MLILPALMGKLKDAEGRAVGRSVGWPRSGLCGERKASFFFFLREGYSWRFWSFDEVGEKSRNE